MYFHFYVDIKLIDSFFIYYNIADFLKITFLIYKIRFHMKCFVLIG